MAGHASRGGREGGRKEGEGQEVRCVSGREWEPARRQGQGLGKRHRQGRTRHAGEAGRQAGRAKGAKGPSHAQVLGASWRGCAYKLRLAHRAIKAKHGVHKFNWAAKKPTLEHACSLFN